MSSHAISADGLALIQQFEGFRSEPTQLPDGAWVVGHGHVRIGEAGQPVERAEARSLLALDLAPVERAVNTSVTTEITQQQFDALVSFAFSIGTDAFETSDVLRRVNGGHFIAAACALDAWRKSEVDGELQIIDALVRRRAAEKALLLADAPVEAAPSVFMRAKLDYAASILGAPISYKSAPDVSVAVVVAKPEPVARIVEILKSEPATELVLTQIATEEQIFEDDEIVTAHAKPVARRIEMLDAQLPIDRRIRTLKSAPPKQTTFNLPVTATVESIGLFALLVFGLGLIALGGFTVLARHADSIDLMGGVALAAPGVAAALLAIYGLTRGASRQPLHAAA